MRTLSKLFPDSAFKKNFGGLFLAMIVFLAARMLHGNFRLIDSDEYFATAELLKSGKYFLPASDVLESISLTKRPFLYPLLLLFPGCMSDIAVVAMQTVLGLFNLFLMLKIFKDFGGKKYRWVALLIILTPSIFINTHLILTETAATTLILGLFILFSSRLTPKSIFQIQLLLSCLIFLKPAFYFFAVLNLFFFLIYFAKIRSFRFSVFLPLLLVAAYIGLNKHRTGYAHFSSIQNINLIDYNLYLFKMNKEGFDKAAAWKEDVYNGIDASDDFKTASFYLDSIGKSEIKNHLLSYSLFHFFGSVRGMFDPGRFDLMT
ncbi:MAG TPA: hypothetical protein VFR70_08925, partial [Flavobacterium sp.]|nr:hypothetical protein [Flavobacterium sp.]